MARNGKHGPDPIDPTGSGEVPEVSSDEPEAEQEPSVHAGTEAEDVAPSPASASIEEDEAAPDRDIDDEALLAELSATLFASPDPLGLPRLRALLRVGRDRIRAALEELGARFERGGLPFVVRELAGGYRILTSPSQAEAVARLVTNRSTERITPAALETLAIVAYRQPVTKAEIEAIRGVQAGPMLRTLVDRGLVRIAGRADQPGAPLLYGTTREFLDRFGLASLDDLPRDAELARD